MQRIAGRGHDRQRRRRVLKEGRGEDTTRGLEGAEGRPWFAVKGRGIYGSLQQPESVPERVVTLMAHNHGDTALPEAGCAAGSITIRGGTGGESVAKRGSVEATRDQCSAAITCTLPSGQQVEVLDARHAFYLEACLQALVEDSSPGLGSGC